MLKLFKSTIVTKQFLQACLDVFGPLIQEKADKVRLENQLHVRNTCMLHFVCFQAAQTHSKIVAGMSDGKDSTSSGSQKGTQKRSGGKKQGKVKVRDRHDDNIEGQWNLQFMNIAEVQPRICYSHST